ncbi:glycoside hydrolase family 30 beta sandwich domain-containing protein [Hephaestia sp. GCM10023244]|uniref:glycoside hydrolase family 30 protein n=1 Tax=unclassified Hephaestia TaxID=2631281 RepID=UPI002077712F|nr:glycoside hydrolase family 30 beta sandwich domain-containing protein [Hephaestia sp. MAHUQ-44]MCM8731005.1 hypothetical protein [Hephaestia sp. MAHUQ-44]
MATDSVSVWLTTPDQAALLAAQPPLEWQEGAATGAGVTVDATTRFQPIVGFGAAISDASAYLIQRKLDPAQRAALLGDLFGPAPGLSLSFTRLTIGASDFSSHHYSYDDMPKGETDPALAHFSIAPARVDVLPTARAALAINPDLKVMATPWSPPGWMKTTDSLITGTLREQAYGPFAAYLARTVQAFAAEGVPVDYLSLQNEPDFEPDSYPGMRLSAAQRAEIVADHVGPTFAAMGLKTRILEWDHNWDQPQQPTEMLAHPGAARYVDGVAWHCYNGTVDAQSVVHDRFPDKAVFFTECSGGEWSPGWAEAWPWMMRNLIIGTTRHWARGVLLWNLALDEKYGPHLGGCGDCRGVVTIDSKSGAVTRNPEYYALGHVSRFVRPGARRIASTSTDPDIESVAFVNPDGARVLVVFNGGAAPETVSIVVGGRHAPYRLAANAAATFVWRGAR